MKRLSPMDQSWLLLETACTPMHVASLMLFQIPDQAGPDYVAELYERLRGVTKLVKPFNQKMHWKAGAIYWETDPAVDLDYHVRHSALPRPGRVRELFVLVSRLHAQLMDRTRPLWECHLIEGLEGNRIALYTKMHHSMIDGVAGMRLMMSSFPSSPTEDRPPPWAEGARPMKTRTADEAGATLADIFAGAMSQMKAQFATVPGVLRAGRELVHTAGRPWALREQAVPYQAPKCILNTRISAQRRFAAQSYGLTRIKLAGKRFDATLNDVVLAMCAGALRKYLISQNALPEKPLIANVPVSIRPADDTEGGNAVSFIMTTLATNIAEPLSRLMRIRESAAEGKARLQRMTAAEITNYTMLLMMPFTLGQLIGTAGRVRPMFNLVISNVPGSKTPIYFNGAKMSGMYPLSLLSNGQALNITVTSYVDSLDFGITACHRSLPGIQRLLDYLEDSLAEIEALDVLVEKAA